MSCAIHAVVKIAEAAGSRTSESQFASRRGEISIIGSRRTYPCDFLGPATYGHEVLDCFHYDRWWSVDNCVQTGQLAT